MQTNYSVGKVHILEDKMAREGLSEEVTFEQSLKKSNMSHKYF